MMLGATYPEGENNPPAIRIPLDGREASYAGDAVGGAGDRLSGTAVDRSTSLPCPDAESLVGHRPCDDPPGFVPRPVTAVAGQKVTVNPSIEPVSNL